jgi:hypothetical protein
MRACFAYFGIKEDEISLQFRLRGGGKDSNPRYNSLSR